MNSRVLEVLVLSVFVMLAMAPTASGVAGADVKGEPAAAGLERGLSPTRKAPDYTQFVRIDADGHFANEHGAFLGYGINYNQEVDGVFRASVWEFDLEKMDADFAEIAECGFSHVVFRMFWGIGVNEDTRAKALEKWPKALDLVRKHGLYVVIWFDAGNSWPKEIPSERRGKLASKEQEWDLFLDWVAEVVSGYKDRQCIIGWRSENECYPIGYERLTPEGDGEILRDFQGFERRKYGTVQALNEALGMSYGSFEEIGFPSYEPDRPGMKAYPMSPVLTEWDYFREWIIGERNKVFAARVREHDPNHLLLVSSIAHCGGHSALFAHHDFDAFDAFDVLGNAGYADPLFRDKGPFSKAYQSILCHAKIIRPFLSFGKPAMITEVGLWNDPEHGYTITDRIQADWILTQWIDCVGGGGTGMDIWEYIITSYPEKVPPSDASAMPHLKEFIKAVAGYDTKFVAPTSDVLVLRNKAADYSLWPGSSCWIDSGNYYSVADWLCQLHIPYDVRSEAGVDAAVLAKYSAVIVCTQTQMYDDSVWAMLRDWLETRPDRVLVVGPYLPRDAHFKPAEPCADMQHLLGLDSTDYAKTDYSGDVVDLVFKKGFGPVAAGSRIPFRMFGLAWDMPTPLAATTEIIAERGDTPGSPVIVCNELPNGGRTYTFGVFFGSLTADHGPLKYDAMAPVYREILGKAGVVPVFEAPTNLGVYVASDESAVLFKERFGVATDAILTADLDGALYDVASCEVDSEGKVTLHESIRAHGWLVAKRLPVALRPESRSVRVEPAGVSEGGLAFAVSSDAGTWVQLKALAPKVRLAIMLDGAPCETSAGSEPGTLRFELPAGRHSVVIGLEG